MTYDTGIATNKINRNIKGKTPINTPTEELGMLLSPANILINVSIHRI